MKNETLTELINLFEENFDTYSSKSFNETEARIQLINPLFELLGWDVSNRSGHAEAYKDVVHEDAVKIGGNTKTPDYSFRVGGTRKFFLEAKRPSVALRNNTDAAFQLRRYAWSAKLPLSILCNFSEFVIYDCRERPFNDDKPSKGRIHYFTYKDYLEKWDEIASIFSKESIYRGSFDRYAHSSKNKRGTAEVDDAFLDEIEGWRDSLAKNIALRNFGLSQRELNYAVHQIIDRIVFLRIAEDRGIEPYGRLKNLQNQQNLYGHLCVQFQEADDRYNSGLFHFKEEKGRRQRPDTLSPHLTIDDKTLKEIIRNLYYPESPYEFSVLSADILGQVYERFLGKVIRLTSSGQAKIEEKPEVRKAGGVYYTPTYVVNHIVKQTLNPLMSGAPSSLEKIKIIDPACGSGSFLLGAYEFLLVWYLNFYTKKDVEKHARGKNQKVFRSEKGEWKLTTQERKRILLTHIYGVDIDPQAVEVTKLSLLLKVLEKESAETLGKNLKIFHERALPDLDANIKCGNSLIGTEFYTSRLPLGDELKEQVNAFDWEMEFSEVFSSGGFSALVGNPPYHSVKLMDDASKAFFYDSYKIATSRFNLYGLFIERTIKILQDGGRFGFIIPSAFLANSQYRELRKFILENFAISEMVNFEGGVFKDATVETLILLMVKGSPKSKRTPAPIRLIAQIKDLESGDYITSEIPQARWLNNSDHIFDLALDSTANFSGLVPLAQIADIWNGINTGNIADRIIVNKSKNLHCKPIVDGKDVQRYAPLNWRGNYVTYDPAYIEKLREELTRKGVPWTARVIKKINYFEQDKLLVQRIRNLSLDRRIVATFDKERFYTSINISIITSKPDNLYDLKYILGIINSRFINDYFKAKFHTIQIKNAFLEILPIPAINFKSSDEKRGHDCVVDLVDKMLAVTKRISSVRTTHDALRLERELGGLENNLDNTVSALYSRFSNIVAKTAA